MIINNPFGNGLYKLSSVILGDGLSLLYLAKYWSYGSCGTSQGQLFCIGAPVPGPTEVRATESASQIAGVSSGIWACSVQSS